MTTLLIGLLIPLLGTMLGASFVFFMKRDMPERLQKALLGFASGVMVAASVVFDVLEEHLLGAHPEFPFAVQRLIDDHFQKYKQGTLKMVKSLKLIDTNPLAGMKQWE